jgi:hypothetical protein
MSAAQKVDGSTLEASGLPGPVLDALADIRFIGSDVVFSERDADKLNKAHKVLSAYLLRLHSAGQEMMRQDAVRNTTFNQNPFMADAADHLLAALARIGGDQS